MTTDPKHQCRLFPAVLLAAIGLAEGRLCAQDAATSTGSNRSAPVTLNPFVVTTSKDDVGYFAQNTLAGSRINSNLFDLSSSITIVTRQQLEDTNSVNLNDMFLYEANTEGTGNYTDINISGGVAQDVTQSNPTAANRIRGMQAADIARNLYTSLSVVPFDSYNTESVEIDRGPNSLLFGLGSPAGIVNQSTSSANLQRNSGEVVAQFGSNDGTRESFQVNDALIKDRLAILVAGLYEDPGYARQPSYNSTRRTYLAISARPTKTTTVYANAEFYRNVSRLPNSITPQDNVSPWLAAGSPTYNPLTGAVVVNGATVGTYNNSSGHLVTNAAGLGVDGLAAIPLLYFNANGTPNIWLQQRLTSVGLQSANQNQQMATTESAIAKNSATMPLYITPGVGSGAFTYDWKDINTMASNTAGAASNMAEVDIDQELTKNLFLSVGWYRQTYNSQTNTIVTSPAIYVDPNSVYLNGAANPNVGDVYMSSGGGVWYTDTPTVNNNYRALLSYNLDLTQKQGWARWFGKHNFTALVGRQEEDSSAVRYMEAESDNNPWVSTAQRIRGTAYAQQYELRERFYLGSTPGRIQYAPAEGLNSPFTYPLTWGLVSGSSTTFTNTPTSMVPALDPAASSRTLEDIDSMAIASQDFFLGGRLVTTLGVRRDFADTRTNNPLTYASNGFVNPSELNSFGAWDKVDGNTHTLGAVLKPFPWLNFFFNDSGNFEPEPIKTDLFSKDLPMPTGKGIDYGVRLILDQEKLVFGLNFFSAQSANARGTPADTEVTRVATVDTWFQTWAQNVAAASLGSGASSTAIASKVASIMQLPAGAPIPNTSLAAGTSTVDSSGLEGSVTYNPLPNWNMKLTVGRQRATYDNIAPQIDSWLAQRLPVWEGAVDASGNSFWNSLSIPTSPTTPVGSYYTSSISEPLELARANAGKETPLQREWRANLINTYRFTSGLLRGVLVGGALRWEDRAIIGYLGAAPGSDGVVRNLNVNEPIYDTPITHLDLWTGYAFKCPWLSDRILTKVQVNVRDVLQNYGLRPIAVNPDGTTSVYGIVNGRQWDVRLTFDF